MINEISTLSFWTSLITAILGLSALWLYYKQKRDHKQNAARVVLTELRHAQKQLDRFKLCPVDLRYFDKLILGNSWATFWLTFLLGI